MSDAKQAARTDAAEDELYGEQRGDELLEHLRTSEGRRAALADARRKLERDRARGSTDAEMADGTQSACVELELDPETIVARVQARRGWEREVQASARGASSRPGGPNSALAVCAAAGDWSGDWRRS